MMRLFKLAAYATLGYVVYQMWQGMREGGRRATAGSSSGRAGSGQPAGRSSRAGPRGDLNRALNEDPGRMMNMTGPGRGTVTRSEDELSGQSVPHLVGRGVTTP
jgi:hypothetical protein